MSDNKNIPWKTEGVSSEPNFSPKTIIDTSESPVEAIPDSQNTEDNSASSNNIDLSLSGKNNTVSKNIDSDLPRKDNKLLLIVIIILLILVIILLLFMNFGFPPKKESIVSSSSSSSETEIINSEYAVEADTESATSENVSEMDNEKADNISSEMDTDSTNNINPESEAIDAYEAEPVEYEYEFMASNPVENLIFLAQTRLLNEADLANYTSFELSAARNGLYAYKSYGFNSPDWTLYFIKNYDWYVYSSAVTANCLNTLESQNADFIKSYEEKIYGGVYNFNSPENNLLSFSHVNYIDCTSNFNSYNYPYSVNKINDFSSKTAWFSDSQDNESEKELYYAFNDMCTISGVNIYSGFQANDLSFIEYNRPAEILFAFSDGSNIAVTLNDVSGCQTFPFSFPITTSDVVITIKSEYNGTIYHNLAISEIDFIGN